ncbi:MAG: alpha/beta hydrolase [Vicinamibacteraceae bacterium]
MEIRGNGPPLVLVPGMQGRWEWMTPTVDALARRFRVAAYSLCGEPGAPPLSASFDGDLARLDDICRALGPEPVVLVGVSFGGRIAVHYAAAHPERVRALVLASAPGPGFTLPPNQARWVARPRLSLPAFVLSAPGRARPELRNVFPAWPDRVRFSARMLRHVLLAPMSSTRAAQRIRLALADDVSAPARRIQVPTLLVTGEDGLDQMVPPESTRRYRACIARTEVARLDGTGHMGVITRAAHFASLVGRFVLPDGSAGATAGEGQA